MYTKNERKLVRSMMRRMKKKELVMVIETLLNANEDQSKTIHDLIDENNKLRKSEVKVDEIDVPKAKAWKSKD